MSWETLNLLSLVFDSTNTSLSFSFLSFCLFSNYLICFLLMFPCIILFIMAYVFEFDHSLHSYLASLFYNFLNDQLFLEDFSFIYCVHGCLLHGSQCLSILVALEDPEHLLSMVACSDLNKDSTRTLTKCKCLRFDKTSIFWAKLCGKLFSASFWYLSFSLLCLPWYNLCTTVGIPKYVNPPCLILYSSCYVCLSFTCSQNKLAAPKSLVVSSSFSEEKTW